MKPIKCFLLLCLAAFEAYYLSSCGRKEIPEIANSFEVNIPKGFPEIRYPADNRYSEERWALGKRLFFDPILSKNNTISCASCHKPEFAFSDVVAFSLGDSGISGRGNAPTLANIAYHPYLTRAGGVPTIEMQILVPIQEHDEFNTNILDIAEKLNKDSSYIRMSLAAYDRIPDPYVITRSIANFERTLISGNSRFDQYFYQGNKNALTEPEKRGMNLFNSDKTNCSKCHSDFNFSNYAFENNGLYEVYNDTGRMRFTRKEEDRAKFKVPTLRNVAYTAPYMHDGSFKSLEEVVQHYNSGGKNYITKSNFIQPLNLTKQEQEDLVAFLKSLSDEQFVTNKFFKQ